MSLTGRAVAVSAERILRKLGVPDHVPPQEAWLDHIGQASEWYAVHGRPWCATEELGVARIEHGRVHLDRAAELESAVLAKGFAAAGVSSAVLVAASAGTELDAEVERLHAMGLPDAAWFLAAYGACVAELLREVVLAGRPRLLPFYAPGYGGWKLDDQAVLYGLLHDRGPLRLGPSRCLTPLRSFLAITGRMAHDVERARFWAVHGGHTCTGDCLRCDCSKN